MAGYKAWWSSNGGEKDGYPSKEFFNKIDQGMANFVEEKLKGEICMIGGKIGTLCSDYATRLCLNEGIAVAPTIIDSHAAFAGSCVSEKNQMLMVLGTSSVVIVLSDKPFSEKGICGGVKDCIVPGFYALESGLASVGDLFEWFVDNISELFINLAASINGTRTRPPAVLTLAPFSRSKRTMSVLPVATATVKGVA